MPATVASASTVAASNETSRESQAQAVPWDMESQDNSSVLLLLVVRPGAPSSLLATSSDALCY